MKNSEKILKMVSKLIETGVLTSQDLAKSIITSAKFNKEKIANKLDLVTREEFDVLKKLVQKQEIAIRKLSKKSIIKKAKKS